MRKWALLACALALCTGFMSLQPAAPTDTMILVNKENSLAEDYVPGDLTVVDIPFADGTPPERTQMAAPAAAALERLFSAAEKDGIVLYGVSGYRSYATQRGIYYARLKETSQEYVDLYIAKAGQSEHQTGLAMDLLDCNSRVLDPGFAETEAYAWLQERAWEFGFIIRYPADGESVTGYAFEPWHIRYVGEAARDIRFSGLCYETWLAKRGYLSYISGRLPLIAR